MKSSACDRCHSIKAKCIPGACGGACSRCFRLHHSCTYTRRRERPGRKPKSRVSLAARRVDDPLPAHSLTRSSQAEGETDETKAALRLATYQGKQLSEIPECYVLEVCTFFSLGPTLGREMREIIRSRIVRAPLLLLDPYVSIARAVLRGTAQQARCSDIDLSTCASALQMLRNARLTKLEDAGTFLALGLSLVTFHRLISTISATTICRFTLSLVRPWYPELWHDASISMELGCLIFLDTTQSLFRGRVPVMEYRVHDPETIDRFAGLCGPLLPLLYRLCLMIAAVKAGGEYQSSSVEFDRLAREITAWAPYVSPATLNRFSEVEMLLLMTQANVHRASALLILHRLRYSFGERDGEAASLSESIVSQLAECLAVTGQYPPNITLAIMVAAGEAVSPPDRERILSLIPGIKGSTFYPFAWNLRMLIANIWSERDQGTEKFLYRLFDRNPELAIPL